MKTSEFYSQIVTLGRRNTPTYRESQQDMLAIVESQIAPYTYTYLG